MTGRETRRIANEVRSIGHQRFRKRAIRHFSSRDCGPARLVSLGKFACIDVDQQSALQKSEPLDSYGSPGLCGACSRPARRAPRGATGSGSALVFVGADALQRQCRDGMALALESAGRGDRCIGREWRHLHPARLAETSSSRVIVPARGRKASRISIAASICARRRRASRAIRAIARPRRGSATLCARSAASRRWEAGALASEAWISRMAGAIDSRGLTRPV